MSSDPTRLRLIYPSSRGSFSLTESPSQDFTTPGLEICYKQRSCDPEWNHLAGSEQERLDELLDALNDPSCDAILCGRGGYGASDILPLIPWNELKSVKPKLLIGFSDISAIQSAFYTKLQWKSIHAPMPDTEYWQQNLDLDIKFLEELLKTNQAPSLAIDEASSEVTVEGKIFGGCLSVLNNLIGTPYLPANFKSHILYFEDVGEAPGKILRNFNQWLQAGLFQSCEAILLGSFTDCNLTHADYQKLVQVLARKSQKPVYLSYQFGHTSPNYPIVNGAHVSLDSKAMQYWKGTSS